MANPFTLKNNIVHALQGEFGVALFSFLAIACLTHSLGAATYGYYALVLVYVETINRLLNFQTWDAIIKFGHDYFAVNDAIALKRLVQRCIKIDLATVILAFVVAWGGLQLFMGFYELPTDLWIVGAAFCLLILSHAADFSIGIFRLFDRFDLIRNIQVACAVLRFALFATAAWMELGLLAFVLALVISEGLGALARIYYFRCLWNKKISELSVQSVSISTRADRMEGLWSFLIHNNVAQAVRGLQRQLDVLVLGKLLPASEVGVYKLALQLGGVMDNLTRPVFYVVFPELAKLLSNGKKKEVLQTILTTAVWLGVVVLLAMVGLHLIGAQAIGFIFGAEFSSGYPIVQIYLLAILFSCFSTPLSSAVLASGLSKAMLYIQIVATVVFFLALSRLVEVYGTYGAAAAHSVYFISAIILALVVLKRQYKMPLETFK